MGETWDGFVPVEPASEEENRKKGKEKIKKVEDKSSEEEKGKRKLLRDINRNRQYHVSLFSFITIMLNTNQIKPEA